MNWISLLSLKIVFKNIANEYHEVPTTSSILGRDLNP